MCIQTAISRRSTAHNTKTGDRTFWGFTVMELMVVMVLLALMAGIVTPLVSRSIHRARESTLRENLFVIRKALDDFYADAGQYPLALGILVKKSYIRSLPVDPITERKDSWSLVRVEGDGPDDERGIFDVHSGSNKKSTKGDLYREW